MVRACVSVLVRVAVEDVGRPVDRAFERPPMGRRAEEMIATRIDGGECGVVGRSRRSHLLQCLDDVARHGMT